jgi:hypothetical protein
MGMLWPKSGQLEFDNNGDRAGGALAYFNEAGTSTPKVVYQDADETTPHEDPVEADGNGRWPAVFVPFGAYKERRTTAAGAAIGAAIDHVPNPAPFTDEFELDETAQLNTGDVWWSLRNGTRAGAVRLNGRTIGDAASGASERANADTADLFAFLWDNLANAQAAVSGGRGATAAADFAANKTIALPDARGAGLIGFDTMGNAAASLLGAAPVVSGGPATAGSILGANTHTLGSGEIPSHAHSFAATTSAAGGHSHAYSGATSQDNAHSHTGTTDPGGSHNHGPNGGGTFAVLLGGGVLAAPVSGANLSATPVTDTAPAHTHTFTTSTQGAHSHAYSGTTSSASDHTHGVSGTTGSAGSGGAHNNLARALVGTWYIKL